MTAQENAHPAPTTEPGVKSVRYVIVVHGIGEQRKGETVLAVINRFAEARRQQRFGDPLTLGMLTAQLGEGNWIEFEGIPADPRSVDPGRARPFVGRAGNPTPGENLRFAEVHWSDLLNEQYLHAGESVKAWADSLLRRLEARSAPEWILRTLATVRRLVIAAETLLNWKMPALSERIFRRYMGDIQVYGECPTVRGRAVRRFHNVMAGIQKAHDEEFGKGAEARYTIIAHSLGSILSLDAILFAHAARESREAVRPPRTSESWVHLPGYLAGDAERGADGSLPAAESLKAGLPGVAWARNVDALVTLGSPIDKFLILWWLNYEHLRRIDWMDSGIRQFREGRTIRHFNYCDEQDPVGHELDVARTAAAVKHVFGGIPEEDVVFNRYAKPGAAHNEYWNDTDLFQRIIALAVDGRKVAEAQATQWFVWPTYLKVLGYSYLLWPVLGWAVATFALTWGLNAESWNGRILAFSAFGAATYFALGLQYLMVVWRQAQVCLRAAVHLGKKVERKRMAANWTVRTLITLAPVLWLYLMVGVVMDLRHVAEPPAALRFAVWLPTWCYTTLRDLPPEGWRPELLETLRLEDFQWGYLAAILLALLFGASNAWFFWRTKARLGKGRLKIEFDQYIANDPTRAS